MAKRIRPGNEKTKPVTPALRRTLNNRLHARTPCSVATHFAANRQLFRGIIKNLSAGGTYIQAKGRFAVGGDVIVAGPFDADQEETKRHGKIVRLDNNGIAVRFIA
jgi:hypothetical protein